MPCIGVSNRRAKLLEEESIQETLRHFNDLCENYAHMSEAPRKAKRRITQQGLPSAATDLGANSLFQN